MKFIPETITKTVTAGVHHEQYTFTWETLQPKKKSTMREFMLYSGALSLDKWAKDTLPGNQP